MSGDEEELKPYVYCEMVEEDVPRIRCMFCGFGHMLECHYPFTCEEAECAHYRAEVEAEDSYDDDDSYLPDGAQPEG